MFFFYYFVTLSLVSLIFLVLSMVFWLFADVCLASWLDGLPPSSLPGLHVLCSFVFVWCLLLLLFSNVFCYLLMRAWCGGGIATLLHYWLEQYREQQRENFPHRPHQELTYMVTTTIRKYVTFYSDIHELRTYPLGGIFHTESTKYAHIYSDNYDEKICHFTL